jgi:hypothetical protein
LTVLPLALGLTIVIMAILKKMKRLRPQEANENRENSSWEVNRNVQGDRD